MTLEAQYKQFLKHNPDTTFSFNEWKQWHGNQIEQALIKMMQDDEELGLYDYDWCKGKVVLPREEIKLEDVFNDEKREGIKKFIHEVKSIPKEEILANRSNAYEFIDFDKQPLQESQNLKNFKKLVSDEVSPAMKEFIKEKETLEEAFNKYSECLEDFENKNTYEHGFRDGAKWQQERSYSEEDMKQAFLEGHNVCRCVTDNIDEAKESFDEWFEQFKKK